MRNETVRQENILIHHTSTRSARSNLVAEIVEEHRRALVRALPRVLALHCLIHATPVRRLRKWQSIRDEHDLASRHCPRDDNQRRTVRLAAAPANNKSQHQHRNNNSNNDNNAEDGNTSSNQPRRRQPLPPPPPHSRLRHVHNRKRTSVAAGADCGSIARS